ncbi:MAG: metal-dependent hydrolase [Candidatus Aenigmatarchaeota archaeon]
MPFAVTHILVPIILVDIYRDHILKERGIVTNRHVLIAGLAGLFPDIDLPISYIFLNGINIHRLFSHNIWFPLLFLSMGFFFYSIDKKKTSIYFLMVAFGFTTHLFLDSFLAGYIQPLYPLSTYAFGLNFIEWSLYRFFPSVANDNFVLLIFSSIDALLLFFWLIYLQMTEKIKDYF